MHGPKRADLPERHDLTWSEGFALAPLVVGLVLLGINPHAVAAFALEGAKVAARHFASFATRGGHQRAAAGDDRRADGAGRAVLRSARSGRARGAVLAVAVATIGLVAAGIILAQQYGHDYAAFGGAFIQGGFSTSSRRSSSSPRSATLTLGSASGATIRSPGSTALMLWSASGAMLMTGAGNLMTIFLGLELLSLGLYCLCAISARADGPRVGAQVLDPLLDGVGLLALRHGAAVRRERLGRARRPRRREAERRCFVLGSGSVLVGIAFKLSLVPFHVWTPDVYEGAPLAVTAFMSVVTKAGALAVLARFAYAALPPDSADAILVPVWTVAALSMLVGNLAALCANRHEAAAGLQRHRASRLHRRRVRRADGARRALRDLLPGGVHVHEPRRVRGRRADVARRRRGGRRRALRRARLSPPVAGGADDVLLARSGRAAADGRLHRKDPDPRGQRRAPATRGSAAS